MKEGFRMKRAENKKKALKIGILGNGFMGRVRAHAYITAAHMFPNLPVRPELYAVSGVDEKSLEEFATCFNIQYYTKNWSDIVEDDGVDIISICLPEHLHAEAAIQALKAGKHVFCEKALALTTSDALAMTQTAQVSDKVNMCGMNYRFFPAIQLARNLIQEGKMGQIYTLRASYYQEAGHDPARPAEDVVYAFGDHPLGSARGLGSHVIDTCRFLLGEMRLRHALFKTFIAERRTRTGKIYPIETDDFAHMTVEFESGAIGTLSTSKVATGRKNWFSLEINGSKCSLEFDLEDLNNLRLYQDDEQCQNLQGFTNINVTEKKHPLMASWWPAAHNLGWEHSHINEIQHFLECVAKNQAAGPLGAIFEDGYRAVALVEQAEQLSRREQAIFKTDKEAK